MKVHTYLISTMIKRHRPYGTFGVVIIPSYHNLVPMALCEFVLRTQEKAASRNRGESLRFEQTTFYSPLTPTKESIGVFGEVKFKNELL